MGLSEHRKWSGRTSGGSFGHGFIFVLLKLTPLWLVYFFMFFVACSLALFHRAERKSIYRYFSKILGYGRFRASYHTLLNHIRFGQVIVDRYAVYAKGERAVKVEIEEPDDFLPLLENDKGIIAAGAHFGNLEIAGYRLRQDRKRIHAFAWAGEEATMQNHRNRAFGQTDIVMDFIGNDMSHLFTIKNTLDEGGVVQMMCDRFAGNEKGMDVTFMGHTASFPVGMFRIADMMDVPVMTLFVARTGYRKYSIRARRVDPEPGQDKVRGLLVRYVALLEDMLRRYPDQWFNYYDFWKEYGD